MSSAPFFKAGWMPPEDPWVFRDGRKPISGNDALESLRANVRTALGSPGDQDALLSCLIQAGEIESALADLNSEVAINIAHCTDAIATSLVGHERSALASAAALLEQTRFPDLIYVSPPEGFTYYAVHPLDFADLAGCTVNEGPSVAVMGIRSIGTTLSAVVAAALKEKGIIAQRMTVRPEGHPYSRTLVFNDQVLTWIRLQQRQSGRFLVVDEGPGRSGSTFLAVADSLVQCGVEVERITIFGSRNVSAGDLCADDAVSRWNRYSFVATDSRIQGCFSNYLPLGGGDWRKYLLPDPAEWPACWPQMERVKYLSTDAREFYKFEGLGQRGREIRERSRAVSDAGFGVRFLNHEAGLSCYEFVHGKPVESANPSEQILESLAGYCAFRASAFRVEPLSVDPLAEMLRFNLSNEFGVDLPFKEDPFQGEPTVIVDGRMQPHEWLRTADGAILKTDASTHGDDHFFPGPTSIAWDIAAAGVEFDLSRDARQFLLACFRQRGGIDLHRFVGFYELAYAVFRAGYCRMALSTVCGMPEEQRLRRSLNFYRERTREAFLSMCRPSPRAHSLPVQLTKAVPTGMPR